MSTVSRSPSTGKPGPTAAQLRDQAIEQAALIATPADWTRLLRYLDHFRRFGAINTLLILRNRPHATDLAIYEQWKKRGHQVRRGERGLALLDAGNRHGTARLFDVTQAGGPPGLGPLTHLRPARHGSADLQTALNSIAARHGFAVISGTGADSSATSWPDHTVRIHPALTGEAACYAIAHELAHILLHNGADFPGGTGRCSGMRFVEAESAAFLVCRAAGINVDLFTFPAPPSWAGADPRSETGRMILAAAERITATAGSLADQVDAINEGRTSWPSTGQTLAATDLTTTAAAPAEPDDQTVGSEPGTPSRARTGETNGADGHDASDRILYEIHRVAERFFTDQLLGSWVPAYLASRGLSGALTNDTTWGIGYASASWTALADHLRACGYTEDQVIASGLGKRSRTGGLIDRFRDRAMLPVRTADGMTIAFIGRANPNTTPHDGHPVPKYLNSPQTAIYTKGAVLYGLDAARTRFAAGAIPVLVEGTFDTLAIALADERDRYAPVAPSGTALTTDQVSALAGTVDLGERGVLVAFDGDGAGQRAAARAHDLLSPKTVCARRAVLPTGTDPADIFRTAGAHQLLDALDHQRPLAELALDAHLTETADQRPWERRDQAAVFIAADIPQAAALALRSADTAGAGGPLAYVHPGPGQAARLLPAATLALIVRASDTIDIPATEMTSAVVSSLAERPVLQSERPRKATPSPAAAARQDVSDDLVTLAPPTRSSARLPGSTRIWTAGVRAR